ncbi:MAG TPA: Gfo/Idh/MocA family oxidoreductase, partial [Polyangia bacterium]|nr:Gfo/Idh/MocA family oxidoreductase [Polyangia bacterium]
MIKVAVVGAGHWGPNLIRNFHNKETSVVVRVADNSQDRLQLVARRFPDVLVSREADQVFADASVEAVVIATPTSTHYALAKAALAAGKHVLVEKPITARACEGEELLALARKQGRVLMVGHVFVYNGAVRRV